MDEGIMVIDITLDSLKIGMQEKEFRDLAIKQYKLATSKIFSPEEKAAIRKQYLDALDKFASVGVVRDK